MTLSIEIPTPDDWHVHLRDDEMLDAVVDYTARRFRFAMVMPNLIPPITSTAAASAYRDRILAACDDSGESGEAPESATFTPLITLYCSPDIDFDDLRLGIESGVVGAVKYYPAGATTNSESGGTSLLNFTKLFEVLIETDTRLLVHAESTDPTVDIFDREAAFLERQLQPLCAEMPELAVTVEHVSTKAGLDFVAAHPGTAATITPHHLARDRSDLLANGMVPDLYCKPVINSTNDRLALLAAATSGDSSFMLGTDSAPHPTTAKYGPRAKAGVFNAAYGLEVVAEAFHQADALDSLSAFVSSNGCAIYGVDAPTTSLRLERTEVDQELATTITTRGGDSVVLFGTEEATMWQVSAT